MISPPRKFTKSHARAFRGLYAPGFFESTRQYANGTSLHTDTKLVQIAVDQSNMKLLFNAVLNLVLDMVLDSTGEYCLFAQAPLVVVQKLSVSTLPKVVSRPEFA
jgi:hypothetical protein